MKPTQQITLRLPHDLAQRLSLLEQAHNPDDADWLELDDGLAGGDFDEQRFLQEREAKALKPAKPARALAA